MFFISLLLRFKRVGVERQRKMLAQGKSPHRHKSRLQDNEGDANAIMNVHLLWVLSKFVCCERRLDVAGFPCIGDEENSVSLEIFQFQGEIFTLREVFRHSAASSIGEDNKSEGSEKLTHSIQKISHYKNVYEMLTSSYWSFSWQIEKKCERK